jgi:4-hydroxyphenylacetate 3-monooxygenase oxygenase component
MTFRRAPLPHDGLAMAPQTRLMKAGGFCSARFQGARVMGVRGGKDYVSGLKAHPREVWIAGRKVTDVTADPAFRRPIAAMASLYDLQIGERRAAMTYRAEDTGEDVGLSFIIPKSKDDLGRRREAMRVWADATFGLMGRSPDFLNTVVASFADAPEVFAECNAKFADNVARYYRHCRDNDLFLTHALVNPPVDRSKSAAEQADEFAYLGVVEETRDGLIVRGAKMLATHGPTADEIAVYPLPFSLRPGEEKYALAFGIPADAKGLRFICREPFDQGDQSEWDHPLGARFEEPDAVAVFDDVLVPWERVFLHGNVTLANTMFTRTGVQRHTGHQTAVRGLAKCEFMTALAVALTRSVKTDGFLHVQEALGECLGYLQLIEGAILLSEQKAEVTEHGSYRPALEPLQALRYHIPRFYERMVQVTQVLGAGGILASPTEADLNADIGGDIRRYYRGAGRDAEDKIRLAKLAWDATGTQFGQRQLQYERYYAGDPVRMGASIYTMQNYALLLATVDRALNLPREACDDAKAER